MTAVGLQWVQATDVYTRLETAVGLTPGAPFNAINPFGTMQRVNLLDNGVVSAVYGDRCYTDVDTGVMGQCMVRIPKCWYYTDFTTPGTYKWYISDTGNDTIGGNPVAWKVHPAFIRNGVTKDQIYFSAYEGYYNPSTLKLESGAGNKPTALKTIAQFRTAAELRAGGAKDLWEQQDHLSTSLVELLYLIEYGGFNSQTLLSIGVTNITDDASTNMAINTGYTAPLGNASGQVAVVHYQTAQTTYSMSYRGIENFYGNIYTFVDGINIKADYMPWVADHGFASDTFASPYVDSKLTVPSTDGYESDIVTENTVPSDYGFLPSATAGSSSTKLCDYYYHAAGNMIARAGGSWSDGSIAGAFCWYLHYASSASYRNLGARLLYIG